MHNRSIMLVLAALALLLWAGLFAFMQRNAPSAGNQFVFLVIWTASVLMTTVPVSYALNGRYADPLGRVGDMNRSLRQGLLAALLAGVLMGLHFLRMLPPGRGLVLVLIVVLLESLFYIRRRY